MTPGTFARFFLSLAALATVGIAQAPIPSATAFTNTEGNQPINVPDGASRSFNWAGYEAEGGVYTGVYGSWAVPTVDASIAPASDAAWVGIGGVNSDDLIQAGTQASVGRSGHITYQAWYETLPDELTAIPLSIRPGDAVSVSLTQLDSNSWQLLFVNSTTGQTYHRTLDYQSSNSSAEWIEEVPSMAGGGLLALDNFGRIDWQNAGAIKNGGPVSLATSGAEPISLVDENHQTLAVPSTISGSGSFTVARADAATGATSQSQDAAAPNVLGETVYILLNGTGYRFSW